MKTSPNKFKDNARGVSTDMSGEAVARRVRIMDQLWTLGNRMRRSQPKAVQDSKKQEA